MSTGRRSCDVPDRVQRMGGFRGCSRQGDLPTWCSSTTKHGSTGLHGKTVYVIGSDYIRLRNSAEVIKTEIEKLGGKLLGAEFAPFGTQDFAPIFYRAGRPIPISSG